MIRRTQDAMARGVENIAEASFSWDGNYCAVDILHKTADGWAIYEVKSSSGSVDIPDTDADYVKYPIILDDLGQVADGNHRIAHAILDGKKSILAYRLINMPAPDYVETNNK